MIFLYVDIRDYEEDNMYKNQVTQWGKAINIMLIYKTNLNKFFIYKQEYIQTNNRYVLTELQNIDIVKQKTGFGYKKFFKCSDCGHKRQNLYFVEDELKFTCRACISVNVYRQRTNLYDGDVKNVIIYKARRLMDYLKTNTKYSMYDIRSNIPDRPKHMRQEKYAIAVKRIYFLYWMWEQCYTAEYGPAVGITPKLDKLNVQEINEMLQEDNANFVYEHFLFPQYHREAYEVLKALKDKGLIDE